MTVTFLNWCSFDQNIYKGIAIHLFCRVNKCRNCSCICRTFQQVWCVKDTPVCSVTDVTTLFTAMDGVTRIKFEKHLLLKITIKINGNNGDVHSKKAVLTTTPEVFIWGHSLSINKTENPINTAGVLCNTLDLECGNLDLQHDFE